MEKFKVGDLCHYSVGSDVYGCEVVTVSANGKTVGTCDVRWSLKETADRDQAYYNGVTIEDVDIMHHHGKTVDTVFKSRQNGVHKTPGKHGLHLYKGFRSYRNPSF